MNQKTINVILTLEDDEDILRFTIDEDLCLDIQLNSDTCQAEIKSVFSALIPLLVENDISLKFEPDKAYSKELYIDVCREYIKDLEREINNCKLTIRDQLSIE